MFLLDFCNISVDTTAFQTCYSSFFKLFLPFPVLLRTYYFICCVKRKYSSYGELLSSPPPPAIIESLRGGSTLWITSIMVGVLSKWYIHDLEQGPMGEANIQRNINILVRNKNSHPLVNTYIHTSNMHTCSFHLLGVTKGQVSCLPFLW